jgi:hypothetical protein
MVLRFEGAAVWPFALGFRSRVFTNRSTAELQHRSTAKPQHGSTIAP